MSVRHQARSVVLQTLFELEGGNWSQPIDDVLVRIASEMLLGQNGFPFAKRLVDTVYSKRVDLDNVIEKAAPEWPLNRINPIDRNVLRIGLSELLFSDPIDVPPKVAINEAIELAKEFGSDASGRFVNGVLGAVYRELGEPLKDAPKSQKNLDSQTEEIVGSVVYAKDGDSYYLALVHDIFGHWTLSKGKLNTDEDASAGAKRKVKEEIGLEVVIEDPLGENSYIASGPESSKKRHSRYFLAQAPYLDLRFTKQGGLDDAQWFRISDIGNLNFYEDMLPIITRAVNVLARK